MSEFYILKSLHRWVENLDLNERSIWREAYKSIRSSIWGWLFFIPWGWSKKDATTWRQIHRYRTAMAFLAWQGWLKPQTGMSNQNHMRTPSNIKLLVASLLFVTVFLNSIHLPRYYQRENRSYDVYFAYSPCMDWILPIFSRTSIYYRLALALLVANSSEINSQSTHWTATKLMSYSISRIFFSLGIHWRKGH